MRKLRQNASMLKFSSKQIERGHSRFQRLYRYYFSERDAAMLLKLDGQIKAAYENAANAAACAKACLLPEERDRWLTLEDGYLLLARSLEISRSVERWVAEEHRRLKGQTQH
jgi:hypothetical protein